MTTQPKSARKTYLAKLHILKKDLDLPDVVYREFLQNNFGVDSAADLSNKQLLSAITLLAGDSNNSLSVPLDNIFTAPGLSATRHNGLRDANAPPEKLCNQLGIMFDKYLTFMGKRIQIRDRVAFIQNFITRTIDPQEKTITRITTNQEAVAARAALFSWARKNKCSYLFEKPKRTS